jgi:hypothetical protein
MRAHLAAMEMSRVGRPIRIGGIGETVVMGLEMVGMAEMGADIEIVTLDWQR